MSLDTLRLVLNHGGPGFAQFALNNACNANCGFCNFARDQFPKSQWKYVERQGGLDAIDTLYKNGARYLVWTGGEPTLHPNLIEFTQHQTIRQTIRGMRPLKNVPANSLGCNSSCLPSLAWI